MLEGTRRSRGNAFFVFAGACELQFWAIMILGQAVGSAELSATVRTLEGKECFLPAFTAFHVFFRAFFKHIENETVYTFPYELNRNQQHIAQQTKTPRPSSFLISIPLREKPFPFNED
jgi:hypothetical protein